MRYTFLPCLLRSTLIVFNQISDLHASSQLPLVVGGTTYWVQHLLFPLGKPASSSSDSQEPLSSAAAPRVPFRPQPSPDLPAFLASLPSPLTESQHALLYSLPSLPLSAPSELNLALWELLDKVDPRVALKWHWKDQRKVLRCLEPVWNDARRESDIWLAQEEERKAAERAASSGQRERNRSVGHRSRARMLNADVPDPQGTRHSYFGFTRLQTS